MQLNHVPAAHPDAWVDLLRGYMTTAVERLATGGLLVERSWLDPRDPRDATVIFSDPAANVSAEKLALVWDEVTGWRRGTYVSGEQGVRTELAGGNAGGGHDEALQGQGSRWVEEAVGGPAPDRAADRAGDLIGGEGTTGAYQVLGSAVPQLGTPIINVGNGDIYGYDGEITLIPDPSFEFNANFAYTRGRYDHFMGPNAAGNGQVYIPGVNFEITANGLQLRLAPQAGGAHSGILREIFDP